jgi:hypothetical protein
MSTDTCHYCGGRGVAVDLQLTNDFWLSEMLKSDTAVRKGLPNDPTPVAVAHCQILAKELLQPLREKYGRPIIVTSGIRMPPLNTAIGGSAAHPSGFAADIHSTIGSRSDLVDFIISSKLPFDQVIFEGTWVHVSRYHPDGIQARGQVLATFDGGKSFVAYDPNDPRLHTYS